MSSPTDRRLTLIFLVVGAMALVAPSAPAQETVAEQQDLPSSPILIDLEEATVRVVVASDRPAELRWWKQRPEDPGTAELTVVEDATGVVITRPDPTVDGALPRLVVEITVHPSNGISAIGRDLDLEVERVLSEADLPDPESTEGNMQPDRMAPLDLRLGGSQIALVQTNGLAAELEGCAVETYQTKGTFELSLTDTNLQIQHHRGNLELQSYGSTTDVEDYKGTVSAQIQEGSIALRGTYGDLNITAISAHLEVGDWRGGGLVAVNQATAEIRDSMIQNLNLKATESQVGLSRSKAKTTADCTGGSLSFDAVVGDTIATARNGTRLDIVDHNGKVKLNLLDDTYADLRGMRGGITATARGAELTVEGADSVGLTANNCWISMAAISKLAAFEVTRSEVELDLSDSSERKFELTANNDSSVRVQLRTPCRVDATGTKATSATDIEVVGCELKLAQGGRWSSKRVRGVDGNLPVTLTAVLSQSTRLTVEGLP